MYVKRISLSWLVRVYKSRIMSNIIKIRKAKTKDIDRILELLVQVNNVHSQNRPDLFLKDKTKYTAKELEGILANEQTPIFVAVNEEYQVLGYAFGVFQSHVEHNNFPDIITFYIDDICVDAACRRQHIGEAIYKYVREYARKSGCYNITLNVWEKNDSARTFYEDLGFHVQKTGLEVIL